MLGGSLLYWKGRTYAPMPGDSEPVLRYKQERRAAFQRDLTAAFVPAENMIRGVVSNAADHVFGSEPTWNLTGEKTAELEKVLTPAWNGRDLWTICQQASRTRIRDGEGAVRVRIPPGAILKAKQAGGTPAQAAAQWLRFEALTTPEQLTITEDELTLTLKGTCDLGVDGQQRPRGIETARIDKDGFTVLEITKDDKVTLLWRLNLGGRLPYVQITGPPLITQGMVDNQAGANMVMTSSINNSELAGQIMEHFHNMVPQKDEQGNNLPVLKGPGGELYTQDTVAMQSVTENGTERVVPVILKGTYERHGPVSSEPLDFTITRCEYNIYAEAKQRHYLMADKASATGEARKTAMASFFKSLAPYRRDGVKLLRELLELTLAMSYALCRQPPPEIEVQPQLTDTLTDPTPEDRAADQADLEKGVISKQTARARQGIIDSPAEQKQIDAEQAANPPNPAPQPTP